jgi:hypothetical protein
MKTILGFLRVLLRKEGRLLQKETSFIYCFDMKPQMCHHHLFVTQETNLEGEQRLN